MMANRRAPLSNIPNAVNSPRRAVAVVPAVSKRSRSHSSVQRELTYGQPPPAKRQMVSKDDPEPRTPPQRRHQNIDGRVFSRRMGGAQMTSFERKLLAARDKQKAAVEEKAISENLENVRQWQKHYRRAFPHFVFYFESLPEESRWRCSKQITSLGAREVKFFSKAVTHVITTRSVPSETDGSLSTDLRMQSTNAAEARTQKDQPRTINPSLLDRSSEVAPSQTQSISNNGKLTFDASLLVGSKLQRNGQAGLPSATGEPKRQQAGNGDVLSRAKEMGMKIWAFEKLQRMMTAMFETDTNPQPNHSHNTRSHTANVNLVGRNTNREAQLSQLLREERLNGPADRDLTVAAKELILFRGPFIYLHDMDERTKPIMVREYPRVAKREDGAWPQFRSVSQGRCPFVEEISHVRREKGRQKGHGEEEPEKAEANGHIAQRTRAAVALESTKMQPPLHKAVNRRLGDVDDEKRPNVEDDGEADGAEVLESLKAASVCAGEPVKSIPQNIRTGHTGPAARFVRGEPVASGVQPSNITSAIRSQMISSTAAAAGAKAGTNKELYELKRKILAKQSGPTASTTAPRQLADISGNGQAARGTTNPRVAKLRAQQKLGHIQEDPTKAEEEEEVHHKKVAGRQVLRKKTIKKDPKPGYCENCRDKFDDFDEHVLSRNHRKFALNERNWTELDALLVKLVRPLKDRF